MNFSFFKKRDKTNYQFEFEKLNAQMNEAANHIGQMAQGNLQSIISENLLETEFGKGLASMKSHLQKIESEEKERSWLNVGLAKFSDILRNKKSLDLKDLSNDILANLIKYVDANQGALFIMEEDEKGKPFLNTLACYAYNRKKYINKKNRSWRGFGRTSGLGKRYNLHDRYPSKLC